MLDVHVLTLADTPAEWVRERDESIKAAVERAGFPVHVHYVDGVIGHIGQGRAKGFACGASPYVGYVDDDDFVDADIFAEMRSALESGVDGLFTREVFCHPSKLMEGNSRHNMIVVKREIADSVDWNGFPWQGDMALRRKLEAGNFVEVPASIYYYRCTGRSAAVRGKNG